MILPIGCMDVIRCAIPQRRMLCLRPRVMDEDGVDMPREREFTGILLAILLNGRGERETIVLNYVGNDPKVSTARS